jgi:uncharacterized membrane protein YphA (DoxX/SURF4 family)
VAEVTVGVVLVTGLWSRPAALAAAALLGIMTAAAATVLLRGRQADCGCFGSKLPSPLSWTVVARNLAFIASLSGVVFEGGGLISVDALPWIRVWAALAIAAGAVAAISFGRARSKEARI